MKHATVSPKRLAESKTPTGHDPVLDAMRRKGIPITRANYLELNYPDGAPDPMPAEQEAGMPVELRKQS